MEKMSLIFFIIIVIYLLYGFIKTRFEKKEKVSFKEAKTSILVNEEKIEKEKAAIAAVIATIMGDTFYVIKRVYSIPKFDEKISPWRYAGRNEMITRKKTIK